MKETEDGTSCPKQLSWAVEDVSKQVERICVEDIHEGWEGREYHFLIRVGDDLSNVVVEEMDQQEGEQANMTSEGA